MTLVILSSARTIADPTEGEERMLVMRDPLEGLLIMDIAERNLDTKAQWPRAAGQLSDTPQNKHQGHQLMAQPDCTKLPAFAKLFDVNALLDIQRENILAATEAHLLARETFQAVAQRQTEIVLQIAEDNSTLAKVFLLDGTPEEKIAQHADLIKTNYEKSVANCAS
jgi:phasin protein